MADQPSPPEKSKYRRRRKDLGNNVAFRISQLQDRFAVADPNTIATLARLRRTSHTPGDVFDSAEVLELPPSLIGWVDDEQPSDSEWASHTALTLYARHQQSRSDQPMHRDWGHSFGSAMRELATTAQSEQAIYRRFAAIGTASSYEELTYHVRTAIALLREHAISLDYGLFADDLYTFRQPRGPQKLRGIWGRDYYRASSKNARDAKEKTPS